MSEGVREGFWLQGTMGGSTGQLDRIQPFSETDFTEDLKRSISQSSSPMVKRIGSCRPRLDPQMNDFQGNIK
jgi:hypothetical protein